MDVLVRVDADCHRPLHHLASLPSCGRPAWTGPCRAKGTQASIRSPASRAKRRRETGPKEGRAETRQLVCGSSRRRLALSAAHRTTAATPRGYTACLRGNTEGAAKSLAWGQSDTRLAFSQTYVTPKGADGGSRISNGWGSARAPRWTPNGP